MNMRSSLFPAFALRHNHCLRLIAVSYGSDLAIKHANDFRQSLRRAMLSARLSGHAHLALQEHRGRARYDAQRHEWTVLELRQPVPACSGRVHPNSLFQQSYAFTLEICQVKAGHLQVSIRRDLISRTLILRVRASPQVDPTPLERMRLTTARPWKPVALENSLIRHKQFPVPPPREIASKPLSTRAFYDGCSARATKISQNSL